PPAVKQMIDNGDLTIGHARALIPARDPLLVAQEVVKRGLNVRQTESLAKRHIDNPEIHKRKAAPGENADLLLLEKEIERIVGLNVKISTQGKAGSLTFFYKDLDQLDDLIKRVRT
ncbi:MAG: chromosome partitioning protein ParB, partial [Pseudomonadota bacterium]|nr:chromosome partitioning protein ParB [Pseudomonadota bacterium]